MGRGAATGTEDACKSPEAFVAWTEELLGLEHEAEDEETTELLVTCTHAELQARGIAVLKLAVAEQTTALYGRACLTLERPGGLPLPVHRITHGDIVGLFDQGTRPLSKAVPLASAVVQRVTPASIALVFDGDIPIEVLDGRQLNLATISSEVTLKRYREALDLLKGGKPDMPAAGLVNLCFSSDEEPRFFEAKSDLCTRPDAVDCAFRAEQSHKLNEPQQAAVVKALCAVDMAVIHGPPGTGKTTTLVAYILEAAYRKQRLLVTAPSNVAVDNLLERVVDCGCRSVVRLGHPARVQAELHRYTMDNVVYASEQAALCRDIKKEIDDALKRSSGRGKAKDATRVSKGELTALRKELHQRERRAVAEVLRHTQVVFATCAGAATLHREIRRAGAKDAAVGSLEFDVVIIDEAAQALEVACWIPLLLGRKAVLAGDHQQLAATVKSNEAQRRGLDRTLFGRMIERHGDKVAALLSIQYRMNSTIMGWSSSSFYSSRLEAAECVASRTLELSEVPAANLVGETLEAMRAPLLFVDTGGLAIYREDGQDEAQETTRPNAAHAAVHQSRANPGEARFLVHYAKMLARCGVAPKDMTVITPYNRQVERARAEFAEDSEAQKLGVDKPRVNTVDSFQGQEADAVLISLVRSNERGVVGFLADYRRLNVAVTRARKHVMLIGDAATIAGNSMLGSLYDYACEHGKVVFVQQLLDESGGVPPDPSAVPEPRRTPKAERRLDKAHEQRQEKGLDEQKVRERFERQLGALAERGGAVEFPSSLNSFERAIAHEVATSLGLLHESRGEGAERRLLVRTPGAPAPEDSGPSAASSSTAAPERKKPAGPKEPPFRVIHDSDSDTEQETPLQAFERRAAALLASLGQGESAAEWKSPTDEELEILGRLASDRGLELELSGSGKKRRCRLLLTAGPGGAPQPPAAASGRPPAAAAGAAPAGAAAAPAAAAAAPNAMLAELHAQRQRRKEEEAAGRRQQNEAAKAELKQAKQAGKQPKVAPAADADDLDQVLLEFSAKDGVCAFGTCKEKVNGMIDAISLCRLCSKRFCLRHAQAELHGCGDAAQKSEQKKWKTSCDTAMNPRGAGLVNKSCGDHRNQVAAKLQEKLKGKEDSRTAKKKDAKKK